MKKKIVFSLIAAVSLGGMIIGCSQVPEQELKATKALIDSARMAEANKYMPVDFFAAQDSLNAAIAEIEKQKSSSLITGNYDRAKNLLAAASTAARSARAQAPEEKQKMKAKVDTLLTKATGMAVETQALLAKAPKGKEGKAVLTEVDNTISMIKSSISEARTMSAHGDVLDARDKVAAGMAKLDSINVELNAAIAKVSSKSKSK